MKKTICDICGKDCDKAYDYSVNIGLFKDYGEISVQVRFRRTGVSPGDRWTDVDMCKDCKKEALLIAAVHWTDSPNLPIEHSIQTHYKE